MATSDSQERDAIDLAGLEDEVNLLLGEVDDLTGGGGDEEMDLETSLEEVDGLLEEWNAIDDDFGEEIAEQDAKVMNVVSISSSASSSEDLVILSPAMPKEDQKQMPAKEASVPTVPNVEPTVPSEPDNTPEKPKAETKPERAAQGNDVELKAVDVVYGKGPIGLRITEQEKDATPLVVVVTSFAPIIVTRKKQKDGVALQKKIRGPSEKCGAISPGDCLYSINGEVIHQNCTNYSAVVKKIVSSSRPLTLQFVSAATAGASFTNSLRNRILESKSLAFASVATVDTRRKRQQRGKSDEGQGGPVASGVFAKRSVLLQKVLLLSQETSKSNEIEMSSLRKLVFYGIPEKPKGLRGLSWRILLNLLPEKDKSLWPAALKRKRDMYREFCDDLILDQEELLKRGDGDDIDLSEDNPLSNTNGSKWNEYYKDEEVKETIAKDVHRTHPGYAFFGGEVYTALKRMLFIFAKLNPGICYIQGMNEIMAPLYYVFMHEREEGKADPYGFNNDFNIEADTFWCFSGVMSEVRDWFIETLDETESGINGHIDLFQNILARQDPELFSHMDALNLNPKFYAFRWITTMLSREFDLPDTVRLWDSLFADTGRYSFLIHICCAMVIRSRRKILRADFAEALQLLQRYPPTDLQKLLLEAESVREREQQFASGAVEVTNRSAQKPKIGIFERAKRKFSRGNGNASNSDSVMDSLATGLEDEDIQAIKDAVNTSMKVAQNQAAILGSAVSANLSSGAAGAAKLFRSWSKSFTVKEETEFENVQDI